MKAASGIAVVIPALEESSAVVRAVSSAFAQNPEAGGELDGEPRGETEGRPGEGGVEVVVVDGGSRDGTAETARLAGARVVDSAPGRGRQLDLGWRSVRAGAVLFLHADSVLPAGWQRAVEGALEDPSVAGGAFRFGFDEQGLRWRLLELGVRLRVKLLKLPYGDQALFVRRSVLEATGGVPHVEILEDLDLVCAIRRAGRLALLPAVVRTSGRRHRSGGLVRTAARHALALAGFYLGLDRAWIAQKVRG